MLRRRTRYFGNGEVEHLYLDSTDLRRGNFIETHLEGAVLWKAHLEEAVLEGAYLHGANLLGVEGLTMDQLEQAIGDETTRLPEGKGLRMPKSWLK